jgi:DNA helicase-2/ATP-dependent DNA helicase PcrA
VADLLDAILKETHYREHLKRVDEEDAETRWENVQELRTVAAQYEDLEGATSLTSFLEEIALVADIDDPGADAPDAVTLITLHSAKGLEYPVVFMPGMEEGVLPHFRSLDDPDQMEEERRVCYVGMTRARERLYLLSASRRFQNGMYRSSSPSRFLSDLPAADVQAAAVGDRAGATMSARERRAALAARESERKRQDLPSLLAGDRVRHAKFGAGVVVSSEQVPGDEQLTVAFEGQGVKKLLRSLAPIEPLNDGSAAD